MFEEELEKDADGAIESTNMYLAEIGRAKLLTAEEEFELAKRASEGDEEAKTMLIVSNLRLVVSVARKYVKKKKSLPLNDLIQEGNIGLMHAVDRYDYTKGYRFSTYAVWWIRQAILRSLDEQVKLVRLPVYLAEMSTKINYARNELSLKFGREPSYKELSVHTGIDIEKIKTVLTAEVELASLDALVGEDGYSVLGDFVADNKPTPEEIVISSELKTELAKALDGLNERERRVIELRYGWHDGRPQTLEDIGKEFGVTRERIRQIEAKALKKLEIKGRHTGLRAYI